MAAPAASHLAARFRDYLARHYASPGEERLGLEIELIAFDRKTWRRIPAEITSQIVERHPNPRQLSVEPGGQLEFATTPQRSLRALESELSNYLVWLEDLATEYDFVFSSLGFDPLATAQEQSWYSKPRYEVMRRYLPSRGTRCLDMMCRTASVQCTIDFLSEEDLGRKFVVGNRLGPIVAAIFAHSPFAEGRATGLLSERYATWLAMDPDRSGPHPAAWAEPFSLEEFVRQSVEAPMFTVERDGHCHDATGYRFREFWAHETPLPEARWTDFLEHLTTLFTDARLRNRLELRTADLGSLRHVMALAAFWKGLLYSEASLGAAFELVTSWTQGQFESLAPAVASLGLQSAAAPFAEELLSLSRAGLQSIAPEEIHYLELVEAYVSSRSTASDSALASLDRGLSIRDYMEATRLA